MSEEAPVTPGDILGGKYRVEQVLGVGGMGVVVAATDVNLERRVAIKFLLAEYVQNHEATERFLREARAAVKIQSEHVARVIDVGTMDTGAPYMVMEYLEGHDLQGAIEKSGQISIENAITYLLQACEAIAEAHAAGIVHRDLKPANLFLARQADGSSKVKVLDFGISKNTSAGSNDQSLTKTSSMMGSPLYMSPEQMRSTKDVDARADIWSLGVILYELLTGRTPYIADTMPQLIAMILSEQHDPISASRDDVPDGLVAVIDKCLGKEPALRYPSIAEFAIALSEFAPGRGRVSVERITKVMNAAGMSSSSVDLLPSVRPAAAGSQTNASWGNTNGPDKTEGRGIILMAIGGAFAMAAAVVFAVVSLSGGGDDSAESPVVAASAVPVTIAPEPVKSAAPEPVVTPVPSVEPEPEPVLEKPAPVVAKPVVKKPVYRKPVKRVYRKPVKRIVKKPVVKEPTNPASKFSRFGGRK